MKDLDTSKETFENKIKLNQDLHNMITNKLNEKYLTKELELSEKNKEITGLKIQLAKISENILHKEMVNTNSKSIDIEIEKSNENINKYEENCYHTFSIDDECFKSADVKLYVCRNDDIKTSKDIVNMNYITEEMPAIKDFPNKNIDKVTEERKPGTHINYSHNLINNIYNNNYFNNKNHLQNFISPSLETEKTQNKNTNPIPQKLKNGFINNKEKDIPPRYNWIYLDKEKSKESLNHSINLEKTIDISVDKLGSMPNQIKAMNKKLTSNKSIQKVIYVSDSQQKINEIISKYNLKKKFL